MPIVPTLDYYAILHIPNTASDDEVKTSYRKLARDLHPDKNLQNPNSTADFQKLAEAYETIKDPTKRRDYDLKWPSLRDNAQQQAKDKAKKAKEQAENAKADAARALLLQRLECHRITYENELFEATRKVNRLNAELKRLQQLDNEDMKREKERNGWWPWISGTGKESEEDKETREMERLNRVASRSVKQNELKKREKEVFEKQAKVIDVKNKITAEKKRLEDDVKREEVMKQAKLAKEQEARRQKQTEELLKQWEKNRKEAQEMERKNQEELRKRQEEQRKREAEERERLIAQFKKQQAAEKELKRKMDKAFSRMMNEEVGYEENVSKLTQDSCNHEKFWPKKEGAHTCSNCKQRQNRFAFQCPDCLKITCANCRQILRGEKKKSGGKKGSPRAGRGGGRFEEYGSYYDPLYDHHYS